MRVSVLRSPRIWPTRMQEEKGLSLHSGAPGPLPARGPTSLSLPATDLQSSQIHPLPSTSSFCSSLFLQGLPSPTLAPFTGSLKTDCKAPLLREAFPDLLL